MLYDKSDIRYVYFIFLKRRLVYIGRSIRPLKRVKEHHGIHLEWDKDYTIVVYGPYSWHTASAIENTELNKRKRNKYLLSKSNSNYGSKEISVKNTGSKSVFYFKEGVCQKKMVC